jgi:two-component system sensor histidine kinase BaeS
MSLRLRLASAFALVAILTAVAIAVAAPTIVGRGFARLTALDATGPIGPGPGMGPGAGGGAGQGPGPMAGIHAQQVQQETSATILIVAVLAAGAASLIGYVLAGRISAPLAQLGEAAGAVAGGDLSRRSGLADRTDELGALGRSFDQMAAEVEDAEASRRRFFQDAAHELKTPLAVIEATTTAVLDGVYQHDDEHLRTIREQSRVLARIVDDLRTISLAEAGDLPLRLEPTPLEDLAASTQRAFGARADLASVALRADVPPGLAVLADRDRLAQVLAALVDNAIRHTPPGGTVSVTAAPAGARVRITVNDTGAGIGAADIDHVFDRFWQADESRDRASGTSGLGLAIVRALTVAQGGIVGVESRARAGARFWVELPAAPSAP